MSNYTIKTGDTLSEIASRYGTTVTAIKNANPSVIKDVNVIRAGQVIEIPSKTTSSSSSSSSSNTELGKAVKACLSDIQSLSSFKKVCDLLG